jgi:hypothetical protein
MNLFPLFNNPRIEKQSYDTLIELKDKIPTTEYQYFDKDEEKFVVYKIQKILLIKSDNPDNNNNVIVDLLENSTKNQHVITISKKDNTYSVSGISIIIGITDTAPIPQKNIKQLLMPIIEKTTPPQYSSIVPGSGSGGSKLRKTRRNKTRKSRKNRRKSVRRVSKKV